MVNIKSRGKVYKYPDKKMDTSCIDKKISKDFAKLCKDHKINKSKLLEEFYKKALLRFREGNLNETNGYLTIDILSSTVRKGK